MYNRSLYEAITPSSALMWQRVQVRGGVSVYNRSLYEAITPVVR